VLRSFFVSKGLETNPPAAVSFSSDCGIQSYITHYTNKWKRGKDSNAFLTLA